MASPGTFHTPYEKRVGLVRGILSGHSEIDDKAADDLAVQVLHALDSIPEKIR